jgi:flagellar hook assembly protein FlgD
MFKGFRTTLVAAAGLFLLTAGQVFAGGGPEPQPEITFRKAPTYISPGSEDNSILSLEISPDSVKNTEYARVFELKIYNKNGEVVHKATAEVQDTRSVLQQTFGVGNKPILNIPDNLIWDGTSDGQVVPDDVYFYQLTLANKQGLKSSTAPLQVVVDTVPPEIFSLQASGGIFSPNDDGVRDTITLRHRTDPAALWTYQILNEAGQVVWSEETAAAADPTAPGVIAKESTEWDGRANQGGSGLQPDGAYLFRLTGVDRAGNTSVEERSFQLNTDESAIRVRLPEEADPYFSSVQDQEIQFELSLSDTEGMESWKVEVKDEDNIVVRRYSGTGAVPESVVFLGMGNPGRPEIENVNLPDGHYTVEFSASYRNGTVPVSEPLDIYLDNTPPNAQLSLESQPEGTQRGYPLVFGGEAKPRLNIAATYEEGEPWNLIIEHESGQSYSIPLEDVISVGGDFPIVWDGTIPADLAGAVGGSSGQAVEVKDGLYQLRLSARDQAGNLGQSNVARFIKDTTDRSANSIRLSQTALSPGGDKGYEVVRIVPELTSDKYIEYFVLSINGEDGRPVFTRSVTEALQYVEWPGVRNNGIPAPDGTYSVEVTVKYLNGDTSIFGAGEKINLNRSRPSVTATISQRVFTPNGDGDDDTITIRQNSSTEDLWYGDFLNEDEEVVRRIEWQDSVEDLVWDGTDNQGNVLPDGIYSYLVYATNEVGNVGSAKLINLKIDNLSATIGIEPDLDVFSPNGDGFRDEVSLLPTVADREQLRGWEVELINETGRIRRLIQGGTNLPESIVWDGQNDAGTTEDGNYSISFRVEYSNGTATEKISDSKIILVKTPPKGEVAVSPERFSPDGDGENDVLTISLDATAADRPIDNWGVEILDPMGNLFKRWSGDGIPPETIQWDGLNDSGELVQSAVDYIVQFRLEDNLKNFHISGDVITVDVLVLDEGDRLRINIPSIVFAPNTADLFDVQGDLLIRNLDTLRRLAEILNKYPDYRIAIEGHAVQIFWNDSVRGPVEQREVLIPLSRNRASEVRQALTILGVDWNRMNPQGIGGARPIVPHGDMENRWKNRRVEFILERK